ncbi:hypothetical protein KFK09_026539 [Dendrobium nobile]|uniref:Uncharacterized protein n=1 Tax=Dendrobium nobile TaxID=94219 RepID=A0A8T3A7S0_DENNO|nr:hypothetical protein KFK09_026539 [Dendrobium nobile]
MILFSMPSMPKIKRIHFQRLKAYKKPDPLSPARQSDKRNFRIQEDIRHREVYQSLTEYKEKLQFFAARQIACRLLGSRGYLCQKFTSAGITLFIGAVCISYAMISCGKITLKSYCGNFSEFRLNHFVSFAFTNMKKSCGMHSEPQTIVLADTCIVQADINDGCLNEDALIRVSDFGHIVQDDINIVPADITKNRNLIGNNRKSSKLQINRSHTKYNRLKKGNRL